MTAQETFAIVRAVPHMAEKTKLICACPLCRKDHEFIVDTVALAWLLEDGMWPTACASGGGVRLTLVARHTARQFLESLGAAIPAYSSALHGPDWRHPQLK